MNAADPMFDPMRRCPAIPRPDAPRWLLKLTTMVRPTPFEPRRRNAAAISIGVGVSITTLGLLFLGPVGAFVSTMLLTASGLSIAPLSAMANRFVLSRHGDRVDGMPITGAGWSLLRDTAVRFEAAKRMIDQVPTGFDWEEIWPDVNVLLWETAKHAAKVSALDAELEQLRWAEPGTPQGAYRDALQRRRDDEYRIMQDAQWEAYSLQRSAGNTAAAAKVALLHVGSVSALERVIPSTEAIRSRIALADARARLALLTEVWAELDPQHTVVAAAIDAEAVEAVERRALSSGAGPAEQPPEKQERGSS